MRTIAVWCPDWPVVAGCAAAGIAADSPAAVLSAGGVVACSATARREGIRRGLRKREAQGRCPELVLLEDDPARDTAMFEPVAVAIEALAPGVEILRPGLVVVPARGPVGYFGTESEVAERIVDVVAAHTGVECTVGIADGIFTATLAAHRGQHVPPGAGPEFLAPLPITELTGPADRSAGDRAGLVDLLRRLGLRTLGAFAALDERHVVSRFGPVGLAAHRLARGLDERPVGRRVPPVDLSTTEHLDPPVDRVDAAAFAAIAPAARLHESLAARGLACTRLAIRARTDHGEELVRVWRCAEPLSAAATLDRVRWQLDAWIGPVGRAARPTGPIVALELVPEETVPVSALRRGLWGDTGEADEQAGRALVRVQGMLGPDAVVTGVPGGGRDPGQRVRWVAWGDERVPALPDDRPWPGRIPEPSPATVPVRPVPAEVLDDAGRAIGVTGRHMLSGRPYRVAVDGRAPRPVLAWAGPWPVDERWWEPGGGRRVARMQVVLGDEPRAGHDDRQARQDALLLACSAGRWAVTGRYD